MKKNFLLFFLSTIIFLMLVEIVLNLIGYRSSLLMDKDESDYIYYNKEVRYFYKPNQSFRIENDNYNVSIKTNAYGYRDVEWIFNTGFKVLVVGDSYSAGFGVETSERFSDLLKNKLSGLVNNVEVFNAAVSGYNLDQINKTILIWVPKIKPKFVVFGLTIAGLERLEDPYEYYKGFSLKKSKVPFARIVNNHLIITHFKNNIQQDFEIFLIKNSKLYQFLITKLIEIKSRYFTNHADDYELELMLKTKKMISVIKDNCMNSNSELIVLPIIQHNKSINFDAIVISRYKNLKEYFLVNDIIMIDILPNISNELNRGNSLWINDDPHWNKAAHKLASDLLVDRFKKLILRDL